MKLRRERNNWGLTYNIDYPSSSENKKRANNKLAFSVKVCPICDIAFELVPNQYKKRPDIHYYKHFYKRGLHKQSCPKCK